MRYQYAILLPALLACLGRGQTRLDLKSQSKNVDFTAANITKPFKSGTALPATCSIGEAFFKSDAPAGINWYACTSLNSWTLEAGGTTLAGDVTGPASTNVVGQIQGRQVSAVAPTGGQALVWNGVTSQWEPSAAAPPGVSFTIAGPALTIGFPPAGSSFRCGNRATSLSTAAVITLATSSAAAGSQAWVYFDCGASALKLDTSSSMNQANITVSSITKGLTAATGFPNDVIPLARLTAGNNAVDQWDTNAITDWHAFQSAGVYKAGAFLSRTSNGDGSATLALDSTKLGNPAGTVLATVGSVGSAGVPACWDGSGNLTGAGCASSGGGIPSGSTLPAACSVGSIFLLTNAPFGQNLYTCLSTNNWSVQGTYGPTVWYYQQYFCPDALNGGYGYGTQRWSTMNGQASFGYVAATDFSHQCGAQITANSGQAGNNGMLFGDQGSGGAYLFSGLNSLPAGASLQFYYRFKVSSTSQSQVILRLSSGGQDQSINSGVDSVGFFLDSSQSTNPANLRFQTCSNGSCTNTDTGVAIVPGQYFTATATTTSSGMWAWSIQSNGVSQSGSQSTNAPGGPMRPGVSIKTLDTNAKGVTVNRFEALANGENVF